MVMIKRYLDIGAQTLAAAFAARGFFDGVLTSIGVYAGLLDDRSPLVDFRLEVVLQPRRSRLFDGNRLGAEFSEPGPEGRILHCACSAPFSLSSTGLGVPFAT